MKLLTPELSRLLFLLVTLLIATNCKNDDPADEANMVCGTSKPIEDLPWLNKKVKEFYGGEEINAVVLYKFDGKQVIEVQNSVFSSTNQHQYFCNGEKLDLDDANKFKKFRDNRTEVKVLYGTKIWY